MAKILRKEKGLEAGTGRRGRGKLDAGKQSNDVYRTPHTGVQRLAVACCSMLPLAERETRE